MAKEEHKVRQPPWHDFLAGNVGGMAQVLVGQPLDTIKVRLQTDSVGRFNGAWDCCVKTVKNEGFLALYKGMLSPLIGIGAVNALLFAANSEFRQLLQRGDPTRVLSIPEIAIAGAGAGIVNSVLASPVEMLKIKMQSQFGKSGDGKTPYYRGPFDCANQLIKAHGFSNGLMRGLWATIVREIPAYAGFYSAFELVKRGLTPVGGDPNKLETWKLMTAGAAGGLGYWTMCYPFDVVKSVVQNQVEPPRGFYVIRTLKELKNKFGYKAWFNGYTPTMIRSVPAAAATFTAYELTMRALHDNTL
ncbi:hypothetical protein BZG36_02969 [Bifiguratus adelaidae]|uniref:Uncharacterized protein n=1 Tax=Bifiguratus adelaidae TaxID=1938954 RepID=A0A261Y0R6_9FUNG|nr:hypothetical protein BZG36_02969 [Bifiguratus adelaidae]